MYRVIGVLMEIRSFTEIDFLPVMELAVATYGENYCDLNSLREVLEKSIKHSFNSSLVAYDTPKTLAGFRLTLAPGQWEIDDWFSPEQWGVPADKVCLFKCNTVRSDLRGQGLGKELLKRSIDVAKHQGAVAGVAHVWMQSPHNSAYRYFFSAGGKEIAIYPDRWTEDYNTTGYICSLDGPDCHCDGAEMILHF